MGKNICFKVMFFLKKKKRIVKRVLRLNIEDMNKIYFDFYCYLVRVVVFFFVLERGSYC